MLNVVLFGPPGSGKGTQAQRISATQDLIHLSTGDILRSAIARKTPLGVLAKKYMDKGELVPDEDVQQMLANAVDRYLKDGAGGFVFDGFPRNIPQAEFLDRMLADRGSEVHCLIVLEVPHEELVKRMISRKQREGRTDDTMEVIENRLAVYERQTLPVIEYYKKREKYYPVDGIGTIDDVNARICDILRKRGDK
jgi:adenylate kinase